MKLARRGANRMKACLAWTAACLLTLVAAASAAHAACVAGARSAPLVPPYCSAPDLPLDMCCNGYTTGAQTVDVDGDLFGNECDPDYNQDCAVSLTDFALFKTYLFCVFPAPCYATAAVADHDYDGTVGMKDFFYFKKKFLMAPGP
jgi:hypothetical protein